MSAGILFGERSLLRARSYVPIMSGWGKMDGPPRDAFMAVMALAKNKFAVLMVGDDLM